MGKYLMRRLLLALPVILGAITINFALINLLPGDPAATMLARSGASAAQVAQLRSDLGLDQPLQVRYFDYLKGLAHGDLGQSIVYHESVAGMIATRLPPTLALVLTALLLAVPIGAAIGIVSALFKDRWLDRILVAISSLGVSLPSFWLALMMILLFSVELGWLPASGQGGARHVILPAMVLAIGAVGTMARTARTSMVEALRQDYVRTARAKGLSETRIVLRHALPNALIPVVTIIGLQFGWLLSNSLIIETVFSRQGIGTILIESILKKDIPVVQGAVLVISGLYVLLNLLVDLAYAAIDPRIRYD